MNCTAISPLHATIRSIMRRDFPVVLSKATAGSEHVITGCRATGRTRARLDSLGLVVGENVNVLSSSWAGLILEIKGSRLAVCKSVADTMEVSA